MIGETIGNYRVTAKLGEGGMGAVFLAEHQVIGRKVAVKVLRPEGAANSEMLHRFFLEARSTASLRHPALVDVFDYGVDANGSPYIIMEYVEGESLAARIARVGQMPIRIAIEIARQIAVGIGVAHAAGLVHRDLKPGNILLSMDRNGRRADTVKILDFGIAKLMSPDPITGPLTQMSAFMGTPMYMAPEQCLGAGNVDHRADIYALGCMMYEMVCGRPPFASPDLRELISAHLRGSPERPRSIRSEIPPDLETIVLEALAKNPAARQKSMDDLAQQLDDCARRLAAAPGVDRSSVVESSSGRSIFPVSKPAKDALASLRDEIPFSVAGNGRRYVWTAFAISTIAVVAVATVLLRRRATTEKSEFAGAALVTPIAAPPGVAGAPPNIAIAPQVAVVVSPIAGEPPSLVPTNSAAGATAKPAVNQPSRAPTRSAPANAAVRAPPAPSASARPLPGQPEPHVLGGEEVENPWPQ